MKRLVRVHVPFGSGEAFCQVRIAKRMCCMRCGRAPTEVAEAKRMQEVPREGARQPKLSDDSSRVIPSSGSPPFGDLIQLDGFELDIQVALKLQLQLHGLSLGTHQFESLAE